MSEFTIYFGKRWETLADAAEKNQGKARGLQYPFGGKVYYAARTGWWTLDSQDLYAGHSPIPTDPRGSPLFENDAPAAWLANTVRNAGFYGRHGLLALLAAYHGNLRTPDGNPTSLQGWDEYNRELDRWRRQNPGRMIGRDELAAYEAAAETYLDLGAVLANPDLDFRPAFENRGEKTLHCREGVAGGL